MSFEPVAQLYLPTVTPNFNYLGGAVFDLISKRCF